MTLTPPRFIALAISLALATSSALAQPAAQPVSPLPQPVATPTATPGTTPTTAQPTPVAGSSLATPTVQPTPSAPMAVSATGPLPATPIVGGLPVMFGSQMFSGRFGAVTFSGFNPDYTLATGDRVLTRLWGAVVYEQTQVVDAQGNIFIPNVGPVKVAGVRNGDLNQAVENSIKRIFRANVGVYATLEAAQPVKVYVTGFVRAPGLYGGLSSDSVLYYLDKAGGIDAERGSYLAVDVMRNGKLRARIDLYKFLLSGQIDTLQLQDGDTIVIPPRRHTVLVSGDVLNPYRFELSQPRIKGSELASLAGPMPSATHISIVRSIGPERRSEYHPIANAADVVIEAGDEVTFTADKYPATIQVRIDGAHQGARTFILPSGAKLRDVIKQLNPAPQADMEALQLFRRSVATRQKENLDKTLRGLETAALTGRSATTEEAGLRKAEAEQILQFVERARSIVPKGQVVLTSRAEAEETVMEDGDVVRLPERSNTITVSGEVVFPNTLIYNPQAKVDDYVNLVGGFNLRADHSNLMVLRTNGSVASGNVKLQPGDEIMVFPKVETKWVELVKGVTSVLFQLALTAKALADF